MVLGSVLTESVSALSSSVRPFLNDLMPLAKSPISSEILPRPPNSRSATPRTRIQCQMLIEPIHILRAEETAVSSLAFALKVRLRAEQKQGLGPARIGPLHRRVAPAELGTAALSGLSPH